MRITVAFTNNGSPTGSLTPSIIIWKIGTAAPVVNNAAMEEIGGGLYSYNFTGYNLKDDYAWRADGTSTLSGADRYVFGTDDKSQFFSADMRIENNRLILSNDNGDVATFVLKDINDSLASVNVYKREIS